MSIVAQSLSRSGIETSSLSTLLGIDPHNLEDRAQKAGDNRTTIMFNGLGLNTWPSPNREEEKFLKKKGPKTMENLVAERDLALLQKNQRAGDNASSDANAIAIENNLTPVGYVQGENTAAASKRLVNIYTQPRQSQPNSAGDPSDTLSLAMLGMAALTGGTGAVFEELKNDSIETSFEEPEKNTRRDAGPQPT